MKSTPALGTLVTVLVLMVVFCGCTGTQPVPQPVATTLEITHVPTPAPTLTPDPYPNASAPNVPVPFGSGKKTGEMTVYGYKVRPTYSWVDPSWNSPREQAESSAPLETQKGYNTKKPQDSNTFLFIYVNVAGTGSESAWAPSPAQIVVASEGKTYEYSPLASAQTLVDGELGKEYDFQIGTGGTGGYVQPGKSNNVKGFLIYEVPSSFDPAKTYVIATPDGLTKGVWKLT
jgi:hypothetical protein